VAGRLVVCPTPIGNLEDVTLRVLRVLAESDVIACEDTRRTRKLLARHGIEARLVSYHEHNERRRARELVERIGAGEVVALVSDAGTPGVSDPGAVVVRACMEAGLPVEVLPGPSAAVTALVASGLPGERWRFAGFLPRREGELRRELEAGTHETLVAYESPRRVGATLRTLAALDPERFAEGARGEVVLVIGPAADSGRELDVAGAREAVERLVEAGARRRAAASVVASLTGVAANRLYGR
jgi:16S rRNA (cytidine1402-2'-O)-methyltransferase